MATDKTDFHSGRMLLDIIRREMNIPDENTWIYNQRHKITSEDALYLVAFFVAANPYGNRKIYITDSVTGQLVEEQLVCVQETWQIDIRSRTQEALERKHEVLMALDSTYAVQQQEACGFQIARIPMSFVDMSHTEGTARLNRYVLRVPILRAYTKSKPVSYYDTFNQPDIKTD